MDATVELVAARGARVGMTEIAQAAGVSRKAVYENFGSQEQVMLQSTINLLHSEVFSESAEHSGGSATVSGLAHSLVEHLDRHRSYYAAVLSGPGGYLVTNLLTVQLATACRQIRSDQPRIGTGTSHLHDRFEIHGFLGVLTEALVEHEGSDLHAVTVQLCKERAAHVQVS